ANHDRPAPRPEIATDISLTANPAPPATVRIGSRPPPLAHPAIEEDLGGRPGEHAVKALETRRLGARDDDQAAAGRTRPAWPRRRGAGLQLARSVRLARSLEVEDRGKPGRVLQELDTRQVPHPGDDGADPIDRLEDLGDTLARRRAGLVGQELDLAHDDRERIVDLVRGARRQARDRPESVPLAR